jgi:hypothetical protein
MSQGDRAKGGTGSSDIEETESECSADDAHDTNNTNRQQQRARKRQPADKMKDARELFC